MGYVAEVWINLPARNIDKPFSYRLPEIFNFITAGWRVLVPFGSRKLEGFVIQVAEGDDSGLKAVLEPLDDTPWFDQNMLATAEWICHYYLCTHAEAMRLFIPGKSGIKSEVRYRLPDEQANLDNAVQSKYPPEYQQLLAWISRRRDGATQAQLHKEFGVGSTKIIRDLLKAKWLVAEQRAKRTAQARFETFAELAIAAGEALQCLQAIKGKPAQQKLLKALLANGRLSAQQLKDMAVSRDTVSRLVSAGVVATGQQQIFRNAYAGFSQTQTQVVLTPVQQQAKNQIEQAIVNRCYQPFLLYGVTGSGKTQVYLEAVAAARRVGRQAIVLVPEIALTGQLVSRFQTFFADDIAVIHSGLSAGERHDAWQRLQSGDAGIAIGARSALFVPLHDLGIIIMDEEHEFTYKQEETPRYHARSVAQKRAELAGAALVLGSATPAIESFYQAEAGRYKLLSMPDRIDYVPMPEVTIVDMREELKEGRRQVISPPMQRLLAETFARGEQSILLLNRRGYSTFVICRECGHVMRCAHCDVSLVYHTAGQSLRCHYCQSTQQLPATCPACGSRYIRFFGTGTQKLEEELSKLLPAARIVRMDQDTTGAKMAHERILGDFAAGKYDILLGTQMVAKGHDIHNVTAVGIVSIDTALNLPDFRAAERTFALLTQAAGRAGRGCKPGKVVVQTYNPEHYAVKAGARHDYLSFYQEEITYRRQLGYPPFGKLIRLTFQSQDEQAARRQAELAATALQQGLNQQQTEMIGPFAAPVSRIKDIFRIYIMIKTQDENGVKEQLRQSGLAGWAGVIIDMEP